MDAAALYSTQQSNSNYGRIRSFGSVGFIVGVLMAGWIFERFGIRYFVAVLLLSAVARVLGAHLLPAFRTDRLLPQKSVVPVSGTMVLRHPGIILVLAGSALINASHGFNNAFSVMHWTNVGISTCLLYTSPSPRDS